MTPAENVNDFLDRHTAEFIAACRQVLGSAVPDDAAYGLVWFQVDIETWDRLPLCHMYCDHHHGCGEPQAPHPFALATNEAWTLPAGFDDSQLGELVFRWVASCWQAAGGAASPLKFYAHNYHTGELFSLDCSCFVQEADIVPPATA